MRARAGKRGGWAHSRGTARDQTGDVYFAAVRGGIFSSAVTSAEISGLMK